MATSEDMQLKLKESLKRDKAALPATHKMYAEMLEATADTPWLLRMTEWRGIERVVVAAGYRSSKPRRQPKEPDGLVLITEKLFTDALGGESWQHHRTELVPSGPLHGAAMVPWLYARWQESGRKPTPEEKGNSDGNI